MKYTLMIEASNAAELNDIVAKLESNGCAGSCNTAATAPVTHAPVTTAPVTHALAGVELDKNGLPWDSRIHSTKKTKNADGTWKYLKGVDRETLVPQVEAELRTAMAAPAPAPAPTATEAPAPAPTATEAPAPAPTATEAPAPAPGVQSESQSEATPPTGAVEAINAAAPAPVATHPIRYDVNGETFTRDELIAAGWNNEQIGALPTVADDAPAPAPAMSMTFPAFMQKVTAAQLAPDVVQAVCAKHQIAGVALLTARPDLIPVIAAELFPNG